jgi:hypothetical protein
MDRQQANIYKRNLKTVKGQFYGIPFTFVNSLYNF